MVLQAFEPEDNTIKLGDMWTRVFSRDIPEKKQLASYPIGQDIQVDLALRGVLHQVGKAEGEILFSPNLVGLRKEDTKLD